MSTPFILALTGYAGCGKSTIAECLAQREYTAGGARALMSFASPLKGMLKTLMLYSGMSEDDSIRALFTAEGKNEPLPMFGNKTTRYLLQTLGTEWGRSMIDLNLWVFLVMRRATIVLPSEHRELKVVCFDDCRFDSEAQAVRDHGGKVVKIERPGAAPAAGTDHASEQGVSPELIDLTIQNDAAPHLVAAHLMRWVEKWMEERANPMPAMRVNFTMGENTIIDENADLSDPMGL